VPNKWLHYDGAPVGRIGLQQVMSQGQKEQHILLGTHFREVCYTSMWGWQMLSGLP
jgi:hypothetical protein